MSCNPTLSYSVPQGLNQYDFKRVEMSGTFTLNNGWWKCVCGRNSGKSKRMCVEEK